MEGCGGCVEGVWREEGTGVVLFSNLHPMLASQMYHKYVCTCEITHTYLHAHTHTNLLPCTPAL